MWRRTARVVVLVFTAACALPHAMSLEPSDRECRISAHHTTTNTRVRWFAPSEARDGQELDAWCRTLGPAIIDSSPSATLTNRAVGDSLAVVTWNVNAGSGDVIDFAQHELGLACGQHTGFGHNRFAHVVLLIQEAYRRSPAVPVVPSQRVTPPRIEEPPRPGSRPDIVELAELCGLALFYVPSMRNGAEDINGAREDRGNAILSTLPLSDFIALELPLEAARRVAIAATVHLPGAPDSMRVVSAHLSTSPGLWRVLRTGNSSRARQALGLIDGLRLVEHEQPIGATVVGGDFNTWSTAESAMQYLLEHFPDSPAWDKQPTRGAFPTDHILFRRGVGRVGILPDSYRRIDHTYYSDHEARIVRLRFGQ